MKSNVKEKINKPEKRLIGRRDKGDFPIFKLKDVPLKIDTGAYTSAIHCHKITKKVVAGKSIIVFSLLGLSDPKQGKKKYTAENYREKRIKNSFGMSEKRFIIETTIKLFGKIYTIDLSLSERGEMKFPILIGRKFLMGKFIVDPSKFDLSYKRKLKRLK